VVSTRTKLKVVVPRPKDGHLPFKENRLLTEEVLRQIEEWHELGIQKIYWNRTLVVSGVRVECDALLKCSTPFGRERWIEVELKDVDLAKVLSQAVERRPLVDYAYVVVGGLSLPAVVDPVVRVYSPLLKHYDIGLFWENQMLVASRYRAREVEYVEEG